MLLHQVLHTTQRYKECLQIADCIADEQHQLYKVLFVSLSLDISICSVTYRLLMQKLILVFVLLFICAVI